MTTKIRFDFFILFILCNINTGQTYDKRRNKSLNEFKKRSRQQPYDFLISKESVSLHPKESDLLIFNPL
jgi:hypothetical protein